MIPLYLVIGLLFLYSHLTHKNVEFLSDPDLIFKKSVVFENNTMNRISEENRSQIRKENQIFWANYNPWTISKEFIQSQVPKFPKNVSKEVQKELNSGLPEYSSFSIHRHNYYEIYYMYLRNVCFHTKYNTLHFYTPPNNDTYKYFPFTEKWKLFKWTMGFSRDNTTFPSDRLYTIDEEGIWLLYKPWSYHIAHFFETIVYPFDILQDPNFFLGPVKKVFFMNQEYEIPYNEITYRHFQNLLDLANIKILSHSNIMSDPNFKRFPPAFICFKQVGLMERNTKIEMGGFFLTKKGSDMYRSWIYKYIGVHYTRENKKQYNFYLVSREKTRKWDNYNEIINLIKNSYSKLLIMHNIAFEKYTMAEQARCMYDSDITMLSHGSGEANIIYMKPYTVVLEGNPPYMFERFGSTIGITSRLYFIHINNQDNNSTFYNNYCSHTGINSEIYWCKSEGIHGSLYIPIPYIQSALNEAIAFLNGIDFDTYRPELEAIL